MEETLLQKNVLKNMNHHPEYVVNPPRTVEVDYEPTTVLSTPGPWAPLLWDMDGTLLDSEVAITRRLRETLVHFDVEPPAQDQLRLLIGPPTGTSLLRFIGTARIDQSRAYYRSLAERDGMRDQKLFPWIPDTLKTLHQAGIPMTVATSKPQKEAERICENFGIRKYFTAVVGADESRRDKASVVAECLIQLAQPDMNPLMIGDRYFDTEGALANNVPAILVKWGYAHPKEFAGAMAAVSDADELLAMLLS